MTVSFKKQATTKTKIDPKQLRVGAAVDAGVQRIGGPAKKKPGRPRTGQVRQQPEMAPFTLYLTRAVKQRAKLKADHLGSTLSQVVDQLLAEWVQDFEVTYQPRSGRRR